MASMLKCMHYSLEGHDMLQIVHMDEEKAIEISNWDFGTEYQYYNLNGESHAIQVFLNGHYYAVLKGDDVFGFFCDGEEAQIDLMPELPNTMDIGFALNPVYIGNGYGRSFIRMIMRYYYDTAGVHTFRLTVAKFNERAIHLYIALGFKFVREIAMLHDGEVHLFFVMEHQFNLKTDEQMEDFIYSYN